MSPLIQRNVNAWTTTCFANPTNLSVVNNHMMLLNPLPDEKILDWSKLKQSADDNFEFDLNSRKFSKLVENTGKGEIARYEQFLLFP